MFPSMCFKKLALPVRLCGYFSPRKTAASAPRALGFRQRGIPTRLDASSHSRVTLPSSRNRIKLSVGGQMRQPFYFAGITQYRPDKPLVRTQQQKFPFGDLSFSAS
jgi:hypothetical protein